MRNPLVLAGDMNTVGWDLTPVSPVQRVTEELVNPRLALTAGVKWFTGFGWLVDVFSLVGGPLKWKRIQVDPTARGFLLIGPNPERNFFHIIEKTRFDDGYCFDFRGDKSRSGNGRESTLANSNERASRGFVPTHKFSFLPGPPSEFKVDWIFVKAYLTAPRDDSQAYRLAPHFPRTLRAINRVLPEAISDHHPLSVDLPLEEPIFLAP